MATRFLIFGIVSTVLIAGIYSSSGFIAFGVESGCRLISPGSGSRDMICVSYDSKGKTKDVYWCAVDKTTSKTNCIKVYGPGQELEKPSLEVKNALDAAIGQPQNTTKVPKSNFDDGGLSKGDNGGSGNDSKVPKDLGELNNDENGPAVNPGSQ
jgi:hypothetical protein